MPTGKSEVRLALAALPKVDLHRHLEGSLRLASLLEVAQHYRLELPATDLASLRPLVRMVGAEPSPRNFLEKFAVLRLFFQSPETIRRLAYEVIADAARDNVRYLELRFTPQALANARSYPLAEVIDWVLAAVASARRDHPALRVGLIASVNRHEPLDVAEQVIQLAVERRERGLVGLDLAGDEVNFPAEPFRALFREAGEAGLGLVAHAGEWTGAQSVRYAIEKLGVQRIGHGVRVVDDLTVIALARERGVVFEVCVTSNLHSGAVGRLVDHPLRAMVNSELRTTINTDDPSVSDVDLTHEYISVVEDLGLPFDYIRQAILTAAAAAFLSPVEQSALVGALHAAMPAFPAL